MTESQLQELETLLRSYIVAPRQRCKYASISPKTAHAARVLLTSVRRSVGLKRARAQRDRGAQFHDDRASGPIKPYPIGAQTAF